MPAPYARIPLAFALCLGTLSAGEGGLQVHGSASQSYLKTFSHDFLIKDSSKGSFEFTEVTLNVFHQYEHLSIGAQLLSRDFGEEGNFETRLDWGYGDYKFNDAIGVKAGKIKLPYGLYNEYRDVDSSRMEILYPQVVIPEDYRDAAEAYEGIGLHGNIALGESDLLYYHLFWGSNSIHDDFFLVRQTKATYESATTISQAGMKMSSDHLRGIHLIWNMDHLGLKLSYNYLDYAGSFNVNYPNPTKTSILQDDSALNLKIKFHLCGAEWTKGPWSFSAETLFRENDYTHSAQAQQSGFPAVANNDDIKAWYLTVRKQWQLLGTYVGYGEAHHDIKPTTTPAPADILREAFLGVRYDFTENVLGKLQFNHYWGIKGTLDEATNPDANWDMFTARVTFHF
jgi:hypothetical protein